MAGRRRPRSRTTGSSSSVDPQHAAMIIMEDDDAASLPLPSNVKTILAAGTPECWSLSGNTSPSRNSSLRVVCCSRMASSRNNNSLLSPSESNPSFTSTLATQEEEDPLFLAVAPPRSILDSRAPSLKRLLSTDIATAEQKQRQRSSPSSMIVTYPSSSSTTRSISDPQQALHMWCK